MAGYHYNQPPSDSKADQRQSFGLLALVVAGIIFIVTPWFNFSQSIPPERITGVMLQHLLELSLAIFLIIWGCLSLIASMPQNGSRRSRLVSARVLAVLAGLASLWLGLLVLEDTNAMFKALHIPLVGFGGTVVLGLSFLAFLNALFYLPRQPFWGGILLIASAIIILLLVDVLSVLVAGFFLAAGIRAIASTRANNP
ncbi:MAG TPA: hypothetical protein VH186_36595 [Chloroflexia bacterium]|nr:hypothetical protein [Chloroflexia bacterium]